jgi:hypothetical protein
MNKYFAVLYSGSDEITACAVRWTRTGDYSLEGFCHAPSRGLSGGIVTDVAAATDSISGLLNKLKKRTGKRIVDVYAGISSGSIDIVPSEGMLLLSKYGRQVTEGDMKRCVQIGSVVKMPLDREALHYLVNGFSIDGEGSIKNPLNLEGTKLSVKMNILTVNSSAVKNLAKCITLAGYVPAGFTFSGLATSYRVLTEEYKEKGVILLDIGAATTEALIFSGGILNTCKVFSSGIDKLLSEDGNVDENQMNSFIKRIVSLAGWDKVHRIVVTGRGAMVDSIIESLDKSLHCPTEIGTFLVKPLEELPPERMRYLGNIGMLDYFQEEKLKKHTSGSLIKRSFNKVLTFVDRYF